MIIQNAINQLMKTLVVFCYEGIEYEVIDRTDKKSIVARSEDGTYSIFDIKGLQEYLTKKISPNLT